MYHWCILLLLLYVTTVCHLQLPSCCCTFGSMKKPLGHDFVFDNTTCCFFIQGNRPLVIGSKLRSLQGHIFEWVNTACNGFGIEVSSSFTFAVTKEEDVIWLIGAHPLCDAISLRGLNPFELPYHPTLTLH